MSNDSEDISGNPFDRGEDSKWKMTTDYNSLASVLKTGAYQVMGGGFVETISKGTLPFFYTAIGVKPIIVEVSKAMMDNPSGEVNRFSWDVAIPVIHPSILKSSPPLARLNIKTSARDIAFWFNVVESHSLLTRVLETSTLAIMPENPKNIKPADFNRLAIQSLALTFLGNQLDTLHKAVHMLDGLIQPGGVRGGSHSKNVRNN
ncbi:MAG: hypothetical protein HXX08_11180 [Chloroflexi bacterium]|uniref:Uncharacterized protein n=1 Tax=Candidatus Chlorohelix allophototropha TaxID=3003348 RepID=A0A8T7M2S4_9CHLR|nr:hypothetical protein [Chloroflexota bacterium]WJW65799.1 hypothetical protein OZ401_001578 [Chloroflexota bacterium L227-S17]